MRFSSLLATDQLDISFTVTGAHQQKYHSVGHTFSKATDQGGIDFTSLQGLSNREYFYLIIATTLNLSVGLMLLAGRGD